jgi:alpha-1,2-mannosyltransferase
MRAPSTGLIVKPMTAQIAPAPSVPLERLPRLAPLAIVAAVAAVLTGQILTVFKAIPYEFTDFLVYRGGGTAVRHGGHLYQVAVNTEPLAGLQFIYTPFAAVFLAPVSLLGVGASELVWTYLNFLALGGAIWVSLRLVGVRSRTLRTALTAAGMVVGSLLSPILFNNLLGQINLLVMLPILIDFLPDLPERWRGIGTGLAAGLKLTPLLFVVYLLFTRRRAAAARAVGAFAATILLGFAVIPSDSNRYWFHGVFYDSSRMLPGRWLVNHSLPGQIARLEHVTTPPSWTVAVSVAVGLLGLAAALYAHRLGHDLVGMLVIAFTAQLVSPVTWMHHGVWVVPALIWLGSARWQRGTLLPRAVFGVALAWYLTPLWVLGQGDLHDPPYQWTVTGEIVTGLTNNLVPAVLAIATLPIWLPRLRTSE